MKNHRTTKKEEKKTLVEQKKEEKENSNENENEKEKEKKESIDYLNNKKKEKNISETINEVKAIEQEKERNGDIYRNNEKAHIVDISNEQSGKETEKKTIKDETDFEESKSSSYSEDVDETNANSSCSDDSEKLLYYDEETVPVKTVQKIFLKKNEKKILESKYHFLEDKIMTSLETLLKYSFRVPEYIIYIKCANKTSLKLCCELKEKAKNVEISKKEERKKETHKTRGEKIRNDTKDQKSKGKEKQELKNETLNVYLNELKDDSKGNMIKEAEKIKKAKKATLGERTEGTEGTEKIKEKEIENKREIFLKDERKKLLEEIKRVHKKNNKIVKRLEKNCNVWTIDIDKINIKSAKTLLSKKLNTILQHRNNLFHKLNIKRVDPKLAEFLKNNNYAKLSNFYFYSPVDIDNIIDIETKYIVLFNCFLLYFRKEYELNKFLTEPMFYLTQLKPNPNFILPFILIYSKLDISNICQQIKKETKCAIVNRENLLTFGNQIGKDEKQILNEDSYVQDENVIDLLMIRFNQYDILSHGCILYNFPCTKFQLQLLLERGKRPHLIFFIEDETTHKNVVRNGAEGVTNTSERETIKKEKNEQIRDMGEKPKKIEKPPKPEKQNTRQKQEKEENICNKEKELLNKIKEPLKINEKKKNTLSLNFDKEIQENDIEECFRKEKNIVKIHYKNPWKTKYLIINTIEEKIKEYQKYQRYKYNNKVAYFKGYNMHEKDMYEKEIAFENNCIVTFGKEKILLPCNIYDNYTIYYNNVFYLVNSFKEVQLFEENPENFTSLEFPSLKFEKVKEVTADIKLENDGFCLVSLNDEQRFIKGNKEYCLKYEEKYYVFESEEKAQNFVKDSQRYLNNRNIFEIILEKMKNKNDVNTLVYLKTYLYETICSSLYELGKYRPLYPGLSQKLSAIRFLALFFYKENKLFSPQLRKKYQTDFQTFLSECELPMIIQKMKKKFDRQSKTKNDNIKKVTPKWSKRDIEKYETYIKAYDKIVHLNKKKCKNST